MGEKGNYTFGSGAFILKTLDADEEVMRFNSDDLIEIDESVETSQYDVKVDLPKRFFDNETFTITFDKHYINLNLLLSVLNGRKITNNWLKMHGGIMTRKGKGRKRKWK